MIAARLRRSSFTLRGDSWMSHVSSSLLQRTVLSHDTHRSFGYPMTSSVLLYLSHEHSSVLFLPLGAYITLPHVNFSEIEIIFRTATLLLSETFIRISAPTRNFWFLRYLKSLIERQASVN